jgi:four helix bundle protein
MATITRFEDLDVWKTARTLTHHIYTMTRTGSFSMDRGLSGQIQRASVSIMSNIAEGFDSRTQSSFIQFLGYARRSAAEVQSQLYVALDQDYIDQERFDTAFDLANKCSRQIFKFIRYLQSRPNASRVQEDGTTYRLDPDGLADS